MLFALTRAWWLVALRGVLSILFGIAAFVWPLLTVQVLILLFGAYAFVDGIFSFIAMFRAIQEKVTWWTMALEGIAGVAAGLIAFFFPGLTGFVLLYIIAAWAILTGILEIVLAIVLRKALTGEWMLALAGVLSVFFGVLLIAFPVAGITSIVWFIAAYSVVFGVILVVLGFWMRKIRINRMVIVAG
jgi:uncharacterized membrane protein HdeD (DUF308 family)